MKTCIEIEAEARIGMMQSRFYNLCYHIIVLGGNSREWTNSESSRERDVCAPKLSLLTNDMGATENKDKRV